MEAVNTNFKVIGLTRLGIKLKYTAAEADALPTQSSELLNYCYSSLYYPKSDNIIDQSIKYEIGVNSILVIDIM